MALPDAPERTPSPSLSWDNTVSRRLLHRWAVSEVLLTDVAPAGPDGYDVAVQWPRGHLHYRPDGAGRHDPLLVVETVRQAGVYLGHAYHGVGMDRLFALQQMTFELDPIAEPDAAAGPTNLVCRVGITNVRRRGDDVLGYEVPTTVAHQGRAFASGRGVVRLVTPAQQAALRARSRRCDAPLTEGGWAAAQSVEPVDPAVIGLADRGAVVLGHDRDGLCVLVDQTDPVFFDHPLDHVPGMLLVQAARQAVPVEVGLPTARLTGGTFSFARFTELCCPAQVCVRSQSATRTVEVSMRQHGEVVLTGSLHWYDPATTPRRSRPSAPAARPHLPARVPAPGAVRPDRGEMSSALSGPGRRHHATPRRRVVDTEATRRVVGLIGNAMNTGDEALLRSLIADDFVDHNARPEYPPGAAGYVAAMHWLRRTFDNPRWEIHELIADGALAVARSTFHGVHIGDLDGIPATGRPVHYDQAHFFEVVDARAVSHRGLRNDLAMLTQLGVLKPSSRPGQMGAQAVR